ncbi:MAG TPA: hypothetical protein VKV40_00815 [Ktedonobacteraceae bacterium]|nr:hypothetical protein [Ktedonobacteraceae bacterium]
MNISTGGPHILFFERDQQVATLLSSEFQLAGYECHTARTAVEVFDAIARYSVRILLVNLAQAAAGRREFWVALDTQRRGRGVQVFTYQCKNIAGYGPSLPSDDLEERPYTIKPDIEVDGMLGIMNLLEAVKRGTPRPTGSDTASSMSTSAGSGGIPRITATPVVNGKTVLPQSATLPTMPATTAARDFSPIGERTAPLQAVNPNNTTGGSAVQPLPSFSQPTTVPAATAHTAPPQQPFPQSQPQVTEGSERFQSLPTQSASEKIRAVIYPGQQSWSRNIPERQDTGSADSGQKGQTSTMESGLAQLSRMIEEQKVSAQNTMRDGSPVPTAPPPVPGEETIAPWQQMGRPADPVAPAAPSPAGSLPLRAAPIQDIPPGGDDYPYSNGMRSTHNMHNASLDNRGREATRSENAAFSGNAQTPPATPLTVLASMMETLTPPTPASPTPPIAGQEVSPADITLETTVSNGKGNGRADAYRVDETTRLPHVDTREESVNGQGLHASLQAALQAQQAHTASAQAPQGTTPAPNGQTTQQAMSAPEVQGASLPTTDTTLLDIMQSLPPMSTPAPQQPPQSSVQAAVLTGRATRSLGSVLLEGHLVPQDRLEVAQNIQRMLRGVDMNYQLGEILLMFKLLTPDQLLAASLVSYGLLTTAQIRALGRIRQELHSIGLEYDLENLLILFRILSPEQLREVRASWNA